MEKYEPLPTLRLPEPPDLKRREQAGERQVYDPIRADWVALTPEEWVRQHAIHFLVERLGVPAGLLAVEKGFEVDGVPRRADVVAFDRSGSVWMLVECKAAGVGVSQAALDQAGRYNSVLNAPFVVVTDGLRLVAWETSGDSDYRFLQEMPLFPLR